MKNLFDSSHQSIILAQLGLDSLLSVLNKDYSKVNVETEEQILLVRRFSRKARGSIRAKRSEPLITSEIQTRSNFVLKATLP